ncbi:MAG: heavy metal-binding domain-containing protein, partial [Alistipes sp.]|nr:heavy metal-binding domain-containing protein [Alistipes sp.]
KLDDVYQNAMYEIEQKAASIGADAVVGLKMDFNEISGKGKTMFMVSAVGTAVKIRRK